MSFNAARPSATTASPHFHALDAIRGVAALIVVCLHEFEAFTGIPRPYSGHLAVDLFFLLSGFVVASAYDKRLAAGMPLMAFIKLRIVRLYPLYFVGFAIGLVKVLVQLKVGVRPPPLDDFGWTVWLEMAMLPTPMTMGWAYDPPYFLNPPAWSLFFELMINVLYAAFHRHLNQRVLWVLIGISGAFLLLLVDQYHGLEAGNMWHNVFWAIPRVAFAFLLGAWLFRHGPRLPALPSLSMWPIAALVVVLLSWQPAGHQGAYDLLLVSLGFPLLVMVGAAVRTTGLTTAISDVAGKLSYSLYIVHMPLFLLLLAIFRKLAPAWPQELYAGPLTIALVAGFCLLLDRYYDGRAREWLRQKLTSRKQVLA